MLFLELIKSNVKTFLRARGLTINEKKSQDVCFSHMFQNPPTPFSHFEFLGFRFMYQSKIRLSRILFRKDMTDNVKIIITPSQKNIIAVKRKLKKLINKNSNLTAMEFLQKLNPVLRDWVMYFSISMCAKILNKIDNYVGEY